MQALDNAIQFLVAPASIAAVKMGKVVCLQGRNGCFNIGCLDRRHRIARLVVQKGRRRSWIQFLSCRLASINVHEEE